MATWLNHYIDQAGTWTRGQERGVTFGADQEVGGRDIEILEVKVSGGAVLSGHGAPVSTVGGPEVFLAITYANGASEYRSAPSGTPYTLYGVRRFTLNTLVAVGNDACDHVSYTIIANAHCQWQ